MTRRNLSTRIVRPSGDVSGVTDTAALNDALAPRVRETVRLVDEHGRVLVDGLSRWLVEFVGHIANGRDNT